MQIEAQNRRRQGARVPHSRHLAIGLLPLLLGVGALAPVANPVRGEPTPRSVTGAAETPRKLPNIVLILADDLGYGDVSCYGATAIETPHIDTLAARGVRFTSGYCSASTCTPTRYSLITGSYAFRQPGTGVAPPNAPAIIQPGTITLPSLLKQAGYRTSVIGKWHLGLGPRRSPDAPGGPEGPDWNGLLRPGPLEIGFDECFLLPTTNDRVPQVFVRNHRVENLDPADPLWVGSNSPSDDHPNGISHRHTLKMDWSHGHNQTIHNGISRIGYYTGGHAARFRDEDLADHWVAESVKFIEASAEEPFFLFFSSHDIHVPRVPHERFQGLSPLGWRGDTILQLDWCVGQIVEHLDRLGLTEQTMIIFCSDNGPVMDDGYVDQALERMGDHRPAGPFSGGKYSVYEGGTRTPFITCWPGTIEPGVSDHLVCTIDLAHSLARLAGESLPEAACLDSFDVLDALLGKPQATGRDHLVQQNNDGQSFGFRVLEADRDWKLILSANGNVYNLNVGETLRLTTIPKLQLFDLATDPGEQHDLAERHPEVVARLEGRLEQIRQAPRSRPLAAAKMPPRGLSAHRGASRSHPENTLAAFQEAIRLGAQQIELDVQLTDAGELVVLHDSTLDRTTDGEGDVQSLAPERRLEIDAGSWLDSFYAGEPLPTLEQVLALMPRDIWLNVHLKGGAELGSRVARLVIAQDRQHQAFLAARREAAEAATAVDPRIMICNMDRRPGDVDRYIDETIARGAAFIQLQHRDGLPSPEQIDRLKRAGVRINYFGTNDPEELEKLFELGIDFPLVDDLEPMIAESNQLGIPSRLPAVSQRLPNIVFIMADDLGWGELGCFGQQRIRTPQLDRLAAQGIRLVQHYAGSPVCAPSRCVLMTGAHPGRAIVRDNREAKPEGQYPLPSGTLTLAARLQQLGYATGCFGKWGLGGPGSTGDPLRQGFDRFFGYNCQRHAHSYYPDYLWSDRQRIELANQPAIPGHANLADGADPSDPNSYDAFKGRDYAPERIHQEAIRFLREHRERPFFLYYPSPIPHVALQVPDEALEPYLALDWNDPPFTRQSGQGYTPHFTPRAAYAAMITRLDDQVGELLALLDELDLAENTIVIFTSDNGTTHLKQEVDFDFFDSVGPLRGLKGSLYEGGVRVPTIVRWPGRIAAGSESSFVSGFEDWIPTLLELVGQPLDDSSAVDGLSIAPTLLGRSQPERPYLYREFPGYGGQQSIRVGHWKAIRQKLRQGQLTIELYDLQQDIGETENLAEQHPGRVAELAELMAQVRQPSADFPLPAIDE